MKPFFRALQFFFPFLLACVPQLSAQDMAVREEAIRLLERATAVSRSDKLFPNHKMEVNFRAYGLDGTTKDGTFVGMYSSDSERYETVFGGYHMISLHLPDRILQNEYQPPPPETLEEQRIAPLIFGRFDKSDTIHSITLATLFGRPAKCIHFETVNGRTHQSNEICVDAELGTLLRWHTGEDLVEYTDFALFQDILMPAHVRHYINGKLRMEIEQKFSVIDGPIDWAALTPPHPDIFPACEHYRRPLIQSAPQPASTGPGPWYDVHVHAMIGEDGHVYDAAVLAADRPDLEKKAVQLVSGWVFSPGVCEGKPIAVNADLVVHFPPQ